MKESFEECICQAERGKEIFQSMFEIDRLSTEDTFLLVVTDNKSCIYYGAKYLADFVKLHHRRYIYILLTDIQYVKLFSELGGVIKLCTREEMKCLAAYFRIFHGKEEYDARIIFLTEKDGYNLPVEELLENEFFSLEEYVAISLYNLENLKEDMRFIRKGES